MIYCGKKVLSSKFDNLKSLGITAKTPNDKVYVWSPDEAVVVIVLSRAGTRREIECH